MRYGLQGVDVTVLSPIAGVPDPFGMPTSDGESRTCVHNVLVDRPTDKDVEETTRQYGASCDLVLHFPKACRMALRGCSVELPAPWSAAFEVLGDPQPYDPALTPGAHDRPVHVRRVVG